jgi:hypothetical protein
MSKLKEGVWVWSPLEHFSDSEKVDIPTLNAVLNKLAAEQSR